MVKCIVPGCNSNDRNGKRVVSFHQLPFDEQRRNEWLKGINRRGETEGSDFIPAQFAVICGLHFSEDSFSPTSLKVKLLKKTAVPTIFPHKNTSGPKTKKFKKIAFDESKQTVADRVEDTKAIVRMEPRWALAPFEMQTLKKSFEERKAKKQFQTITDAVSETLIKPTTSSHSLNPVNDSSITDDLSLNMTCVRFPINDTDSQTPATVNSELNCFHRVPETVNSSESLFQTPVLIIEEIVSEEEL